VPIVVTQYITAITNVVVIKDKNVSLILSDSNICMILNVNKNNCIKTRMSTMLPGSLNLRFALQRGVLKQISNRVGSSLQL